MPDFDVGRIIRDAGFLAQREQDVLLDALLVPALAGDVAQVGAITSSNRPLTTARNQKNRAPRQGVW